MTDIASKLRLIISQNGWVDTQEVDVDSQVNEIEALIADECRKVTHQATAYTTLHMEEWHLNRLIDISNGFKTVQELKDESYKRQEALRDLAEQTKDKEG